MSPRTTPDHPGIIARFTKAVPLEVMAGPLGPRELRRLRDAKRPVLLRQQARDWPALRRWTFASLAERARGIPVELSLGTVEQHGAFARRQDLGRYIAELAAGHGDVTSEGVPYLSLFPLFSQFPELQADLVNLEVFGPLCFHYRRAFIGPGGTVTGLHADHYPNLLIQVRGRKWLALFPPEQSARLYPSATFDFGTALSQIDLLHPDLERFPELCKATPTFAELDEADVLYNPPGWWHFVVALSPSISVSCFAAPLLRALTQGVWDLTKLGLHELGLFSRGNCLCHPRLIERNNQ